MSALLGALVGLLAALPVLHVLRASAREDGRPGFGVVVAGALAPFLLLQVLLVVVWLRWPAELRPFGSCAAFAFLVVSAVAGLAAWRRLSR